jgi:hypothetical protein
LIHYLLLFFYHIGAASGLAGILISQLMRHVTSERFILPSPTTSVSGLCLSFFLRLPFSITVGDLAFQVLMLQPSGSAPGHQHGLLPVVGALSRKGGASTSLKGVWRTPANKGAQLVFYNFVLMFFCFHIHNG